MTETQKEKLIRLLQKEQQKLERMSLKNRTEGKGLSDPVVFRQSQVVNQLIYDIEQTEEEKPEE